MTSVRGYPSKERVNGRDGTEGAALRAGRRLTGLLTEALVGARFLPVWIATAVLLLFAKIIAPDALQCTSWAFVRTSKPRMRAVPSVGGRIVARMRKSVLLPPPFGPRSANSSPSRTSNVTPARASRSP